MVNPTGPTTPSAEQYRSWAYYGIPRGTRNTLGAKVPTQAVGEVRYVVGWMADQMVRMGWRVLIDGSETWTLALPDGTTVRSAADQDDVAAADHPANASRTLLGQVSWDDQTVRKVTTNLFVAGELYYLSEKDRWTCVSMIDERLKRRIDAAPLGVRGLWPHPADETSPDAPLFGVLSILDDMAWLTRLERSQSANRVAMRGIIGIADQMQMAGSSGNTEQFWNDFQASLARAMDDPEDVSPVGLRGPAELVKPEGSGMGGLSWLIPDFPYDERIDERMKTLVQRLAYGLPIPPEILLGMQAQSRATAFQVEGAAYTAHIEPAAMIVAQVPEDALRQLLPDGVGTIRVIPDPASLLARRHTVQDVVDAFDRGAVGYDYYREIIGIPERATPTDEDFETMAKFEGRNSPDETASTDPANDAADEAVTAAATLPPDGTIEQPETPDTPDDAYLADVLHRIDQQLAAELTGASEQAVVKARERIGAAIRSNKAWKAATPDALNNEELALKVGADALDTLGIDTTKIIDAALASTLAWWSRRLARAQEDTKVVLAQGGVRMEFSTGSAQASEEQLQVTLTAAVLDPTALTPAALRTVIDTAGA